MTTTRYRADQVGSFLRPMELLDARAGGASPAQLKPIEDKAILDVLPEKRTQVYDMRKIVAIIEDIADQTNLLALNAAIEEVIRISRPRS